MTRFSQSIFVTLACFMLVSGAQGAIISIQEVLYDGPDGDADDVFTELFGSPGTSLTGWSLVGINGFDGILYRSIDLTGNVIPVDGVFVLTTVSANATLAAQSDFTANVDWQNGPDAVQLWNGATLIDALQYGDAGIFNAGEGGIALDVAAGISLSRDTLGTDTNDNSADFTASTPTPGIGPAVAPVPIPAAAWLFGSALGLLGWMRRKAA